MEELELLEEYASLLLTIDQIALLLGMDASELRRLIRHGKNDHSKAYNRGKLKTIMEVRKQTVEFAKKGSPAAEALVNSFIIKQLQNE